MYSLQYMQELTYIEIVCVCVCVRARVYVYVFEYVEGIFLLAFWIVF